MATESFTFKYLCLEKQNEPEPEFQNLLWSYFFHHEKAIPSQFLAILNISYLSNMLHIYSH